MIAGIVEKLMTALVSWLFAKGLEYIHGREQKAATDKSIDDRLAGFKAAYKGAFDGNALNKDDRTKLNTAIADFIRGGTSGGL